MHWHELQQSISLVMGGVQHPKYRYICYGMWSACDSSATPLNSSATVRDTVNIKIKIHAQWQGG